MSTSTSGPESLDVERFGGGCRHGAFGKGYGSADEDDADAADAPFDFDVAATYFSSRAVFDHSWSQIFHSRSLTPK